MKLTLITIAAVVLAGCGESQQSAPALDANPVKPVAEVAKQTTPTKVVSANKGTDSDRGINSKLPTVKAPGISIHEAAEDGNIEAVKQHLAVGTDVNAKDRVGETPLHYAARHGHKVIVELLIVKGANVNAKTS